MNFIKTWGFFYACMWKKYANEYRTFPELNDERNVYKITKWVWCDQDTIGINNRKICINQGIMGINQGMICINQGKIGIDQGIICINKSMMGINQGKIGINQGVI